MTKILIITLLYLFSWVKVFSVIDSLPEIRAVNSLGNFLYVGIDNYLVLEASAQQRADLKFECTNGFIYNDSAGILVIPVRSGFADITIRSHQSAEWIVEKRFYVNNLPLPVINFCDLQILSDSKVKRSTLLFCDSIYLSFSSDILHCNDWASIDHIIFGHEYGGRYKTYRNEGNRLSDQTKGIIASLPPGRRIYLRAFVKYSGGIVKGLPAFHSILY